MKCEKCGEEKTFYRMSKDNPLIGYWHCGCEHHTEEMKGDKMKEQLKIISDGITSEVYLYGHKIEGIRNLSYTNSIDEVPILKLELIVLHNPIYFKGDKQ